MITDEKLEELSKGYDFGDAPTVGNLAREALVARRKLAEIGATAKQIAEIIVTQGNAIDQLRNDIRSLQRQNDTNRLQAVPIAVPLQPGHDTPYRVLTEAELAKLQALCDSREYLYWWDMGCALLTIKELKTTLPSEDSEPISDGDVSASAFLDGGVSKDTLCRPDVPAHSSVSFKPKDITLSTPLPLANSDMRKVEREFAAALIVRALQKADNEWKPIALKLIQDSYNEDVRAKLEPWASIERNPFYRPDFVGSIEFGLIESGTIDGMTHLVFTEKGLQALSKFAGSSKDS